MSYNGSGVFTINTAGQPVITGTTISSTTFNSLTADLATGLTTALTKDGQSTPTSNIGMGAFKITNLAAGTVASDAARLDQVQGGAATFITVTGTDTLTGTVVPALSAYATGNQFSFLVANTNTGAVTINVDGIGSKAITRTGTTALVAGDMVAGQAVEIIYDGTRFQLVNGNSFTNLKVSGTLGVTGVATFTALTDSGNLTFTGTGNRITGDMSNATVASRVAFQTSTANSQTTVGIIPNGTAFASALSLEGDSALTNGTTFQFVNNFLSAGTDSRITSGIRGAGTYLPMTFHTGGSERVRIDTSGNVGIGTSSPAVKLSVQQDQAAYSYFDYTNATNGGGVVFRQIVRNLANTGTTSVDLAKLISSGFVINNNDTGAANYTGFGVGASERMRIDSSGNVGIGTASPSAKLDVSGANVLVRSTASSGFAGFYASGATGQAAYNFFAINGTETARIYSDANNYIAFATGAAATERMRISSSGDVSLTGKLTVNGKWAGTGSSAGVLGGTIIGHECERNGTGSATNIMAFGNGSTSGKGLRMPFAGKLYAATLSGTLVTGTVTVDFAINNVPNASYSLTGTGTASDISATGNYLASPLSFAAGDTIGWYQTTVPTVANGYFVSFYIMFD